MTTRITGPLTTTRSRRNRRPPYRPLLERVERRWLPTTLLVTTAADSGPGSLRQAIVDANANPGADAIDFAIETTGVPTIHLQAALPPVVEALTIDGTTQPGSNGAPYVELDGTNAGAAASGLQTSADGVVIRGLVINRFQGPGILVLPPPVTPASGQGVLVQNNYIGTDVTGTARLGNGAYGVFVLTGGAAVEGNVISGNGYDGVRVAESAATGVTITNNVIGLDVSGTHAIGNVGRGIDVRRGASGTTIVSNTIAANFGDGIHLQDASGVVIGQNTVGLPGPGLGNGGAGVAIDTSTGTQIGSLPNTQGPGPNTIQDNIGPGISGSGVGAGNAWLGNVIRDNGGGVGITLTGGANNNQQPPAIDSAVSFVPTATTVTGTAVGTPGATLVLQFFANPATDPAEGNTYLTTITATACPDGTASFSVVLPVGVGQDVTATATNPTNGSSEFAAFRVPPPFTVTNVNDRGFGSLRQAILNANAHPNASVQPDVIDFRIPGAGPYVIRTAAPLVVTDPVVIDGYTQAGSRPNTAAVGDNAVIPVVVDGAAPSGTPQGATASGLVIVSSGGGSTVRGLVVSNFLGAGIYLESGGNRVVGNFVGTDPSGTAPRGNALGGVVAGLPPGEGSGTGNLIGGTDPADRNVISGNNGPGVYLFGAVTGNVVQGNLIGTDRTGFAPLGNANIGVLISDSSGNVIGGSAAGAGNVISGNRAASFPGPNPDPATTAAGGVVIVGPSATGNLVAGNLIGTNAAGTGRLGNAYDGVGIAGAAGNTVGGAGAAGNTISANGNVGVRIAGVGASGNLVLNNRIGTDVTGTRALGNVLDGVFINGAPRNVIGAPGLGNVISANGHSGVNLASAAATGNLIQGNLIGTGAGGAGNLGNFWYGVMFQDAAGNTVGGSQPGARNVILNNRLGAIGVYVGGNPLLPGSNGGNTIVGSATPAGPLGAARRVVRPVRATPVRTAAPTPKVKARAVRRSGA